MTEIEPTTTMATTAPTTSAATTQIAETTGEQFVNLEFVLPCGGDIIKKYSPSEPIYRVTGEFITELILLLKQATRFIQLATAKLARLLPIQNGVT